MPVINANGCHFHYEQLGKGRDLVFIHGEIHGAQYWEHQVAEFSKDYRCTTYNRRGHAGTEWTEFGFSLVNQTRDLAALMEKLEVQRPIIIALAFGTTIAANYTIENPNSVAGLVLGAWSELHDAMQYAQRWAAYNARSAEVLEREGREAMIELVRREGGKSMYLVIPVESPIRESAIRMMMSHPIGEYRRGMLEFGLSVPNLVPRLKELDVPVLGICGADDPYPDQPDVLQGMKNFHEAPRVKGAGRFVHWEKPAEFNAVIRKFLQSLA